MARGNPNPKNKWVKGQSGNPKGNPVAVEIGKVRRMNYEEFLDALAFYGSLTPDQLKDRMKSDDCSLLERGFGMLFGQFAQGDEKARTEIFNRLFGRVKEVAQLPSDADPLPRITLSMPDNGRRAKALDGQEKVIDVETK